MIPIMSERKYAKALGKTIKALRGAKTQKQVAETAGIPISTLSKIEQARQIPRNDTFAKIAHGLGLTVAELEQEIVENTLGALEEEHQKAAGLTGLRHAPEASSRLRDDEDLDLSGVPRAAALRLKSTLSTIEAMRNQLDNLEHDVRSLAREFQMFRGPQF